MVVCWFLAQIPLVGIVFLILILCLAIYMGKKGNEWAWYGTKKWKNLEHFTSVQKMWGAVGPFAWFVIYFIALPIVVSLVTAIIVFPDAGKIITQAETISQSAVKQIVSAPEYKNFENGEDISKYLVEKNIYKKFYMYHDLTAVMADKKGMFTAILTFKKDGKCKLADKNCYVIYSVKTPKKLDPVMKTYFNDKGKTVSEKL